MRITTDDYGNRLLVLDGHYYDEAEIRDCLQLAADLATKPDQMSVINNIRAMEQGDKADPGLPGYARDTLLRYLNGDTTITYDHASVAFNILSVGLE